MRALLDVSALVKRGHDRGLGRYTRAVIAALNRMEGIRWEGLTTPGRLPVGAAEWLELPYRQLRLRTERYDLYHATSAYHLGWSYRGRAVCSVLDIIPLDMPEYRRTGRKADYFHGLLSRCDAILCFSEYGAGRLVERLALDRAKIVVGPMPVPVLVPAPGHALVNGPYVVSVIDATVYDPRKRLVTLLTVLAALARRGCRGVLVGAGTDKLSLPLGVVGLGRLPDDQLARMVSDASVFLYASAYEGQGLPPQEALSLGTPVAALSNTSLPEMLGEGASFGEDNGRLDDPKDVASALEAAAWNLLSDDDLRTRRAAAGIAHVRQFSPARFLAAIERAYRIAS